MLTITLVAVCLGVGVIAPGLRIALSVLVTPAFIRTAMGVAGRQFGRRPEDTGIRRLAAVVTVIGVATAAAFCAICSFGFFGGFFSRWPGAPGPFGSFVFLRTGMLTGIGLGSIVGIFVAYLVIRWLWRRKG